MTDWLRKFNDLNLYIFKGWCLKFSQFRQCIDWQSNKINSLKHLKLIKSNPNSWKNTTF